MRLCLGVFVALTALALWLVPWPSAVGSNHALRSTVTVLAASPTGANTVEPPQAEHIGFAMGTYVKVQLYGARAQEAVQACVPELVRLEAIFDRFNPRSELSRMNAQAGAGWFSPSADLWAVLMVAMDVAAKSGGAYDPTVAPLVDVWGFREKNGQIPDHAPPTAIQVKTALSQVGYKRVSLDQKGQRVSLVKGTHVDFGGVAKGYALDRLAAIAAKYGVKSGLIDLGGNISVLGEKANGSAWRIAVRHPRNVANIYAVMPVRGKSVATSGDYQRYFIWKGQRYGHILDPQSGFPAKQVIGVTVLAPTGVLSDALSTATYVLGPEKGAELLQKYPGTEAVFIDDHLHMTLTRGLNGVVERVR